MAQSTTGFANLLVEHNTANEEQEVEKMLRHVSMTSTAFNSMIDIEGRKVSTILIFEGNDFYVHLNSFLYTKQYRIYDFPMLELF